VVLALALAAAVWLIIDRSVIGFRLRMLGRNPKTAHRAGVDERRYGIGAMLVSGGLAGLAGGVMLAGGDFGPYQVHMEKCGIRMDYVRVFDDQFTPQCFITTDLDNNQITAFHPGAMLSAHKNHVRDIPEISFAIVAPDSRDAMLQHVDEFAARGVPFIFDPGQAMPLFDGAEFRSMIEKATYVIVNDYESQLLQQRTGWSAQEIASRVKPVEALEAMTVAPGMAAPWSSSTRPTMVPVVCCADAETLVSRNNAKSHTARRIVDIEALLGK